MIRRAAETVRAIVAAAVRAYLEYVNDRARDDIRYTSPAARRSYRATWEPRRRPGAALAYSIRNDLREATTWLF